VKLRPPAGFTQHRDPGAPDPLPSGTVLMTSLLDRDDHPAEEFAPLYHLRWAQEETYKCFKCRVEVENWSGKSSLTIRQDFHAFTLNLTAVLTRTAQQQVDEHHRGDNHPKQVNLTHALCALKGTLVRLLTRSPGTAARLDRRLCPYRRAGSPETLVSKTQRPPRLSHGLQAVLVAKVTPRNHLVWSSTVMGCISANLMTLNLDSQDVPSRLDNLFR
jgi:hypothetical protein